VTDDALTGLAGALGAEETDERVAQGRAIARSRLDETRRRPVPRSRRRARRAWLVPAVALLVVLAGGAAIAQTTGLVDQVLGSDEPITDRIGSLDDPGAPGLTDTELEQVFDQGSMKRSVGDRMNGDDGVVGATIVDDRGGLRVSLVRTERRGVCVVLSDGSPGSWSPSGTACIGFPPGWPVNEGRSSPHAGVAVYYGVLADGVQRVRFHVDGRVVDPVVENGTYLYWPRANVQPTAIDAVLEDGTVIRRDLTVQERTFAELSARMGMASRCADGVAATVAEYNRRREACNERYLADVRSFAAAKPFIVTAANRTSAPS
jgi:hypothetical protein